MKVLDLFSGIGGFSLGLERAGMETIAFCEIDPFCQKVLKKHWPEVPIYDDIRELEAIEADVITGGFPCQPFSVAGKRRGSADDRSLWPEMYRVIKAVKPRWVIAENVPGIISMELDNVLSDLESENYTCWPFVLPACAVDARHRRDRIWIVGYSGKPGWGDRKEPAGRMGMEENGVVQGGWQQGEYKIDGSSEDVPDAECLRESQQEGGERNQRRWVGNGGEVLADTISGGQSGQGKLVNPCCASENEEREANRIINDCEPRVWATEPNVGRVANGIPRRVDRLKSLGNAIVPQVVTEIGRVIMETEDAYEVE